MDEIRAQVTGIVLAGGRATRMGGVDKGLVPVNGRPMVAYVIDALRPQVARVLINANRSHDAYAQTGCAVFADADSGFLGPLAGMLAGMRAAGTRYIVTAPCDSPLLSADLVARLYAALADADTPIAAAHDGQRLQPVFSLLSCGLADHLAGYLADGGRKIDRWYLSCGFATADFSDVAGTFANINEPADKRALEQQLAGRAQPAITSGPTS